METVLRPGEEACVSVPIRDNQVLSSTRRKSFSVVLAGANSLIRVEGEATATVTITDDDGEWASVQVGGSFRKIPKGGGQKHVGRHFGRGRVRIVSRVKIPRGGGGGGTKFPMGDECPPLPPYMKPCK